MKVNFDNLYKNVNADYNINHTNHDAIWEADTLDNQQMKHNPWNTQDTITTINTTTEAGTIIGQDPWNIIFTDDEKIELRNIAAKNIKDQLIKLKTNNGEVCFIQIPFSTYNVEFVKMLNSQLKSLNINNVVFIPDNINMESLKIIPEEYITHELILAVKLK